MGVTKSIQSLQVAQRQDPELWQVIENAGYCNVVKNIETGEEAEEYSVIYEPKYNILREFELYEYRRGQGLNLVRVLFAERENSNYICAGTEVVRVKTERIPYRLSEIQNISLAETFYILQETLVGFKTIFEKYGPIRIDDNMVGVTPDGRVKVWLNENFANNHPEEQTDFFHSGREPPSQATMVDEIFSEVEAHTNGKQYPRVFKLSFESQNIQQFFEAIAFLSQYCQTEIIDMPMYVRTPRAIHLNSINPPTITTTPSNNHHYKSVDSFHHKNYKTESIIQKTQHEQIPIPMTISKSTNSSQGASMVVMNPPNERVSGRKNGYAPTMPPIPEVVVYNKGGQLEHHTSEKLLVSLPQEQRVIRNPRKDQQQQQIIQPIAYPPPPPKHQKTTSQLPTQPHRRGLHSIRECIKFSSHNLAAISPQPLKVIRRQSSADKLNLYRVSNPKEPINNSQNIKIEYQNQQEQGSSQVKMYGGITPSPLVTKNTGQGLGPTPISSSGSLPSSSGVMTLSNSISKGGLSGISSGLRVLNKKASQK